MRRCASTLHESADQRVMPIERFKEARVGERIHRLVDRTNVDALLVLLLPIRARSYSYDRVQVPSVRYVPALQS